MLVETVQASIRLKLIITFLICLIVYQAVYVMSASLFGYVNRYPIIDYSGGLSQIDSYAQHAAETINHLEKTNKTERESFIPNEQLTRPAGKYTSEQYIDDELERSIYKMVVLDLEGNVLKATKGTTETRMDVHNLIAGVMEARNMPYNERREYTSFYPIDMNGHKSYLVVSGIPQPSITYENGTSPLSYPLSAAAFFLLFFWLTRKKMRYIENLANGVLEISKGKLDYRVKVRGKDELGSLAGNINRMALELQQTIEEERRAEKTKNELVTNVSHDLRTPLTLIIGYLRLLKDKSFASQAQADSYTNIAYAKAEKLNGLIEDLFEYTKLSNDPGQLVKKTVCLNELLEQLIEELVTYTEEHGLQFDRRLPAERIEVSVDAEQMLRVFENILMNAIKYSEKPGVIDVSMTREGHEAEVCVANRGEHIPQELLPRLFDRFYRADTARTSDNGGSGLGLAIAKSIVELHNGTIRAESADGTIRFCVRLKLES